MPPQTPTHHKAVRFVFIGAVLVAVGLGAVLASFYFQKEERVTAVIRSVDGQRSIVSLDIFSGNQTVIANVDPNDEKLTDDSSFKLLDGSSIELAASGIVQWVSTSDQRILIASPTPPSPATPLAVWGAGERIAWRSPADRSVQVFAKNDRGVYLPIALSKDLAANSLAFTEAGDMLVVASLQVNGTTDIYTIDLKKGSQEKRLTVDGLVTVIQK